MRWVVLTSIARGDTSASHTNGKNSLELQHLQISKIHASAISEAEQNSLTGASKYPVHDPRDCGGIARQ